MKFEGLIDEKYNELIIPLILAVAALILVRFLLRKNSKVKRRLSRKYLLELVQLLIILACVFEFFRIVDPSLRINNILLKGSALIVAIFGFAGQAAISDIICGLLITINKPFEIGDRISIEGGETGIVEDITLRHTVIRIYDDIRVIIPNSELNAKTVTNTSYHNTTRRGIHLRYAISYDTNINRAMDVIRDCVVESPYTLSIENNGIIEDSGPVYFLEYTDSALMLDTTIWVTRTTNTYVAMTDVNTRVHKAFAENGIEIPYNYVNVVQYEGEKKAVPEKADAAGAARKTSPSKRHYRTNTLRVKKGDDSVEDIVRTAQRFAKRQRLDDHEKMQLELMSEESFGIICDIVDNTKIEFWVEGSGYKYRIHLRFDATVGSREYAKLVNLSTEGKNEAVKGLTGKIWEVVTKGLKNVSSDDSESDRSFEWRLNDHRINEDEIGESILASVASNITVNITKQRVEFVVVKVSKG